jgi:selenocysteine lyase/cysteine desulfurase
VVATAGTIGTGTIDPLPELRALCDEEGLWLHVDGALGAPAVLTARGRALLRGLERADSLAVDPHKWLFQPPGAGRLLVRDGPALERTLRVAPTFRRDDADLARLPAALLEDGFTFVNATRVRGMTVLRICTINPRATYDDVERTIARLGRL